MRKIVLAGIFALSASTSLAQTGAAPAPAAPAAETATPAAPAAEAPTDAAAAQPASAGGPANLCQELLAFMKAPPPEATPAPAAKPAAEPAKQEAPAQQAAPAQQSAPADQGSSALAGTTSAGEGASAKPANEATSAQAVTGQGGVATDAPKPSDDKVGAGSVANAPQKDRAAPMPPADVTSTPKDSVITVEKAEELAAANDIAVCQDTAREMRVSGVSMPPPLLALTALDLQYQQKSGPTATEQNPATQTPAPQ